MPTTKPERIEPLRPSRLSRRAAFLTRAIGPWVIAMGLCSAGSACAKKKPKQDEKVEQAAATAEISDTKVKLKFAPDAAQQADIQRLLKKLNQKNWRFPSKETNKPDNARLFTYLAATSDDPAVIGASLAAMYGAYSSHSKRKAQPDEDFVKAVELHLGAEDPKIATRAFLAARTAIAGKNGNQELIEAVSDLAKRYDKGPARYAIIDTLRVVSSQNRNDKLMQIFTESLEAKETYVVSYALQALYRSTRTIKDPAAVKQKALELAKHEDPGVRGRAIELLGALGKDDEQALQIIKAGLSDKDPYVRSEAAESISRLRYRPAIHDLIPLLDDKEKNRYDIRGWTALDGKPGRLHHDGSPWSYVYDAAMNAIRSLSGGELKLERIDPKAIEKGLDENAAKTKAWYAKNKSKIPTPEAFAKEQEQAAKEQTEKSPASAQKLPPKTDKPAPKPPRDAPASTAGTP